MTHEAIAKKHAENIMQRVNDTSPRTLNIDVLVDEISKAIKEAARWQNWPPTIATAKYITPQLLVNILEAGADVRQDAHPDQIRKLFEQGEEEECAEDRSEWRPSSTVRYKRKGPVGRIDDVTGPKKSLLIDAVLTRQCKEGLETVGDPVTTSHDRMRAKLAGKPE